LSGTADIDARVRVAAFAHLEAACGQHGDTLAWQLLREGFQFEGKRMPLLAAQQGIYKPAILDLPLSFNTTPPKPGKPAPYRDGLDQDGLLTYRYRGTDPDTYDNAAMRRAIAARVPLIYFFGVETGWYMPVWPVYIVGDRPEELAFKVAVDDQHALLDPPRVPDRVEEARRSYITVLTTRRLHQATFRQRVLRAYQERCAICQLRRTELLDAAHILPDRDPRGEPVVSNGSRCATSTTRRSIGTSSALRRTSPWRSAATSSRSTTARCSATASRRSPAPRSTCRASGGSSPTAHSSRRGTYCSRKPAEAAHPDVGSDHGGRLRREAASFPFGSASRMSGTSSRSCANPDAGAVKIPLRPGSPW
jgi:putative restriction endonuclease